MGLTGALQIGRTALMASQAALEIVGNNLANVATRGYHRQEISLTPAAPQQDGGLLLGRGVQIEQIVRRVDDALEARIRAATSDQSRSEATLNILSQIETLQNQLDSDGNNVSGYLEAFFATWTQLQGRASDPVFRNQVLVQGEQLASFLTSLRSDLVDLREQVDRTLNDSVSSANDILSKVQTLNHQIMQMERGQGGANALRDQRDQLLGELSSYMDISVSEQPNGMVDVFVGSLPIVLNGDSRGLELERTTVDGQLQIELRIAADGSGLSSRSGTIGALIDGRETQVNGAMNALDEFTSQLIWQVNRIHSQGQGTEGFTAVISERAVADATAPLCGSQAGLEYTANNGNLTVYVRQKSTDTVTPYMVRVNSNGAVNDTTLNGLAASFNNQTSLTARVNAQGRLEIATQGSDFEFFFGEDTSGVLAALGINSFFSGSDARDIAVRTDLGAGKLAVATSAPDSGEALGNGTALAMGELAEQELTALGGVTLADYWNQKVAELAQRTQQASLQNQADAVVSESLQAQQQTVSGVNTDEEAINLLAYQRAYQGSARFLTVVDELMQTLLSLI